MFPSFLCLWLILMVTELELWLVCFLILPCLDLCSCPGGGGEGNSLTFMTGVIMSGHFLKYVDQIFRNPPKIMLTNFFLKLFFIDNSVLEHFSLKRPLLIYRNLLSYSPQNLGPQIC